jgi:hypothetical protein
MAGGLMQLVASGAQNQYVSSGNEMSFWQQNFRRPTNYSMESVRQTFITKPVLEYGGRSTFTCRVGRVADLLANVYFSFQLPDIYSDEKYRFQWIKNVAQYMIYSYSIRVDTTLIDQSYGEWMDIWNDLTLPTSKKTTFDRMTGNVQEFTNPVTLNPKVIIENNQISYTYYPTATSNTPSIKGRRFVLPLNFWFTRNTALALPLVAMQYQQVEITLELRGANELYQIYDEVTDLYYSPEGYRAIPGNSDAPVLISNFTRFGGGGPNNIDLDGYLECNYIFLDEHERRMIATKQLDYLIERVYRSDFDGVRSIGTLDLTLSNPVKEIVFITRRGDVAKYNTWSNFTATNPENNAYPILKTAKFIWNGLDRLEEKPAYYFNQIQAFEYHTGSPREGIYPYAFSVLPEKTVPSGFFNASMVSKIQLYVTMNDINEEYEVVVYSLYWNVFRIMGGQGSMVFAN